MKQQRVLYSIAVAPPMQFFHYKWSDTKGTLERFRRNGSGQAPYDGHLLRLLNPVTGDLPCPPSSAPSNSWSGDFFVVPLWHQHSHANASSDTCATCP